MFDLSITRSAALVCVAAILLAGCGNKDKAATSDAFRSTEGVLVYVPDDTPFLLASGAPLPEDLLDALGPGTDRMFKAYQSALRDVLKASFSTYPDDVEPDDGELSPEQVARVMDEFVSLLSPEGLREAGITRDSQFAIYGHGLLPVMRFQVSDAKKFEAAIARIEEAADAEMQAAELDGNAYRYVTDDALKLVVGTFGDNAVMAFAPAEFGDVQLKELTGLTLPAKNIAASGRLHAMAEDNGLTDHYIGFLDTVAMTSIFVDEPTGLNRALFELGDYDATTLSDVCRDEMRGLAQVVPLIVAGYDDVADDSFSLKMVMRLRDDIASSMTGLAADVPGLGTDSGGLGSFGVSFNLLALRNFYEARLDAMESDPYECEYLQELQASAAEGRMALQQPIPPIIYGLRGFNFVVDDIADLNFAGNVPPRDIDATVLVAVDDAPSLIAMGTMFSPELAALDLKPDGKPVALNMQQVSMVADSAFVAMTDDAIAISIGEGAENRSGAALVDDPPSPPLTMGMDLDASRYYELIAMSMMEPTTGDDPMSLESREAMRDAMLEWSRLLDRTGFDIRFTDRGMVVISKTTLAD